MTDADAPPMTAAEAALTDQIMVAAQAMVALGADMARQIDPDGVMATTLTVLAAAHGAVLACAASAVTMEDGSPAGERTHLDEVIATATDGLKVFAETFWQDGRLIEAARAQQEAD